MHIRLTSVDWWIQMFLSTFLTLVFIYILKQANKKVNIPVVSDIINEA